MHLAKILLCFLAGAVTQPAFSQATPAADKKAQDDYRRALFDITSDPRFPGVDRWQALLQPTADFKKELVARKLVNNVNTLYKWHLANDGKWTTQQANDVMYEIVAKPGFELEKALRAIAANRKP